MKTPKTKGILPLSFVNEKLTTPLNDAEDFIARMERHVDDQVEELYLAQEKHQLPSIKPLAESIKNGLNILDFQAADELLEQIQVKTAKMQDDEELKQMISRVVQIWKDRKNLL
jgi:hypothetical protein